MDPLSALSLASNIVQLVDVGTRVVSASFELYSPDGITMNGELGCVMSDLVKICSALERPQDQINGPQSSDSELQLIPLSKTCKILGEELLSLLNSLKVQSPHKKWQSFRQALKAVWKEKAIERYKDRITDLRSEISLRLISILRDEQSNVALALNKLSESHRRLEIRSQNQAAQLQTQITTSLDKLTSLVAKDCREPTSAMADLTSQLSALAIEGKIYSKQLKVIESLRFEMIFERRMRIVEAYPTTFEWLFAKRSPVKLPGVSMLQWLQECNGIYWVSGKAGSGKSTLMKFLVNDERTQQALKTWAGGKRLIVASYFFWNAGTDMQKSQLGLLQTLLYTVLQQCPALVSQICRSQMEKAASSTLVWTRAEVLEVLKELGLRTSDSTRFCFFIDGLDEFDGEHTEVLDVMESLTSDHIKICFSSRPWNVFQNAYGANCGFKLQLQDINRQDIMRFVKGTLSKDRHFRHLKASDNRYDDLVNEIVERASGVFLWVFLVVQSLRRGMCNSDTISELQDRLRILPTKLEEFFQHILDSVEKVYHRQAARIYLMCLAAKVPVGGVLTTMTASFFDEKAPNFGLTRGSCSWDQDEIEGRAKNISRRISARCTDLIEVSEEDKVEFLHRTVHDFLHLREVHDLLVRRAGADFDAHQYMCNATLCQLLVPTTVGFMDPQRVFAVKSLVESFLDHAYEMEFHSSFTNVRLLKQLNREDDPIFELTVLYPEGWLVVVAVQRGLYGYLCQEIAKVRALIGRDFEIKRNPLLAFALGLIKEPRSLRERSFSLDARVVGLLLDNGANPNEMYGDSPIWKREMYGDAPIWKRFMDDLVEVDEDSVDDRSGPLYHRTKVIIIEMLFRHGANLTMSDIYEQFDREPPLLFTSEEFTHLENILNTTRGKRQRSASTASQDPPLKRPSGAAINLPDSRPDL